ncbi:MAG: Retrotransposon-derived protein peg10 [Peltula sp. TS41687]|nr:MAG: Retrotransposon-derived protein peg10 [Peltula sp. TS41687]
MQQVLVSVSDGLALLCLPLAPLRRKRRRDGSAPITLGIPRTRPQSLHFLASHKATPSKPSPRRHNRGANPQQRKKMTKPAVTVPKTTSPFKNQPPTIQTSVSKPIPTEQQTPWQANTAKEPQPMLPPPHTTIPKPSSRSPTPTGSKGNLPKQKRLSAKSKQSSTEPAPSPTPQESAMQRLFSVTEQQNGWFQQQFLDPNPRATAMKRLMQTKQGTDDIQTYLKKVTPLVNDSDIGAIPGKAIIQADMNQRSRTALVYSTVRMTEKELMEETIENFCERAGQIIRRYFGVSPIDIARLRGPLSNDEKARRRREGLCLYCGKAGHMASDCRAPGKKGRGGPLPRPQQINAITGGDGASRFEDVTGKDEGTA